MKGALLNPALALWLLGCAEDPAAGLPSEAPQDSGDTDPGETDSGETGSDGTDLGCGEGATWNSVGQPFLLTYCTGCHSSHVTGDERKGAPEGVDFDTLAGAASQAGRIRARVLEDGDMPPGGGPGEAELLRLAAWLDCDAPGDAATLPTAEPEAGLLQGYDIDAVVSADTDDPELLAVLRTLSMPGTDWREGDLSLARYLLDPDEAWLVDLRYYEDEELDGDAELALSLSFEPPLQLIGAESPQDLTLSVWDASGSWTADQTWTVATGATRDVDPRVLDDEPDQILAAGDGGMELGWLTSETLGIVAAWQVLPDGSRYAFQQLNSPFLSPGQGAFPIEEGSAWSERVVLSEDAP